MIHSNTTDNIFKAFVSAQGEFSTLPKDCKGYGYNYTNLDTVISSIRPVLQKHGLAFSQLLSDNTLTTMIIHTSGEYFGDQVTMPEIQMAKTNAAQNLGAAITYMKRYALCSILGISSDEDVDGNVENHENVKKYNENYKKTNENVKKTEENKKTEIRIPSEIQNILNSTYSDGKSIFGAEMTAKVKTWIGARSTEQILKYLNDQVKLRKSEMEKPKTELF